MKVFFVVAITVLAWASSAFAEERRIVSLSPATTEWVYALGAGTDLVGRTENCDYPSLAQSLPAVGRFLEPNIDAILRLKPTLILATTGFNKRRLAELERLGVPLFRIDINSLASLKTSVMQLAKKLGSGAQKKAFELWNPLQTGVPKAAESVTGARFLGFVDLENSFLFSENSFVGSLFARFPAKNLVNAETAFPQMAFPWLRSQSPDHVFLFNDKIKDSQVLSPTSEQMRLLKKVWLRTVQKKQVHVLPSDLFLRPGPRISEAFDLLRKIFLGQPKQ